MEILSYPVGLVIGLFPVIVDLAGQPGPARVLLDGRPVCEVTAKAPACLVDMGPDPRIRALDLERLDEKGNVVESIRRWINRPSAVGRVRAVGHCDEKKRECEFHVQWAHPAKLDPTSVTVSLDGKRISEGVKPLVRYSFPKEKSPQVLTVDADFPDGRRADFTQLLHGSYPEQAVASLHPVPIELASPKEADGLADRLRGAGWKVRAIEEGDAEILFVLQPKAISRYAPSAIEIADNAMIYGGSLEGQGQLWFLPADEALALLQPKAVGERIEHWLKGMIAMTSRASLARVRLADAVAAAAYRLGAAPRRRIIVLVLGADFSQPDASTLSPAQALDFLRESGVPLVVWRVAVGAEPKGKHSNATPKWPEWPEGDWVRGTRDFPRAIAHLREVIDRQRIAWVEDEVDPDAVGHRLPVGVALAGRSKTAETGERPAPPPSASAPDARTVYDVLFDPRDSGSLYSGTAIGLLHSSDGGKTWTRAETGSHGGVFALAYAGQDKARLFAGVGGGLVRGGTGAPSWGSIELPAVMGLASDPSSPSVLYAGGQGRIFKTSDAGDHWTEVSSEISSFALDLAVDPRDATVYAGTAGSGVFKSRNHGKTWSPAGAELQNTAVRCLALDANRPGTLYAGTDGGVFVSANAGGSWKLAGAGLPRAVTYALAVDARTNRIFAGTAAGLFVSDTGARSWKRFPALQSAVTSLAFDRGGERIAAGTLGQGVAVFRVADVEAQIARAPAGILAPIPGTPEGILPATATGPDLPLEVELAGVRRAGASVAARLEATVHLEAVRGAIAENGGARLRLTVLADSPTMSRANAAGVEQTVPYDPSVDQWTLAIPAVWPARATRLIVALVEEQTGAHAVVTLEAPKPE